MKRQKEKTPIAARRALWAFLLVLASMAEAAAQLWIVPAEPISPTFSNATRMAESATALRVRRLGGAESELTVAAQAVAGTATADDVRLFGANNITFPSGVAEISIAIAIRNDLEPEPEENFYVRFTDQSGLLVGDIEVRIVSDDLTQPIYNPLPPEAVCFQQQGTDYIEALSTFSAGAKVFAVWRPATAPNPQYLQRHLISGEVDPDFRRLSAYSISVFPDSLGGAFVVRKETMDAPSELIRLLADGTIDPSFQPRQGLGTILRVHEAPNGTPHVLRRQANDVQSIVRLIADGTVQTVYTSPGQFFYIEAMEVDSQGNVFYILNERLYRSGAGEFTSPASRIDQIKIYPDGLFVEAHESPTGPHRFVRLRANGSEDPAFRAIPVHSYASVWNMPARDAEGRFYNIEGVEPRGFRLLRYTALGELDQTFVPGTFESVHSRARFMGIVDGYLFGHGQQILGNRVVLSCDTGYVWLTRVPLTQQHPKVAFIIDAAGVLQNTFLESAGNAALAIARTGPNSEPLRVGFQIRNGTALAGTDFVGGNGALEFAPGITRATTSIPLINDRLVETEKRFYIDFFAVKDGAVLGSEAISIRNDDLGLAVAHPTILPDGRLRIRVAHDLDAMQTVRSSTDLANWTAYPSYQLGSAQYIDADPREGTRFFATEQLPERNYFFR